MYEDEKGRGLVKLARAEPRIGARAGDCLTYNPETGALLLFRRVTASELAWRLYEGEDVGDHAEGGREPGGYDLLCTLHGSEEAWRRWRPTAYARDRIVQRTNRELREIPVPCAECGEPFKRGRITQKRCAECIGRRRGT